MPLDGHGVEVLLPHFCGVEAPTQLSCVPCEAPTDGKPPSAQSGKRPEETGKRQAAQRTSFESGKPPTKVLAER